MKKLFKPAAGIVLLSIASGIHAQHRTITIQPVATINPCAGTWADQTVLVQVQKSLYANGIKMKMTKMGGGLPLPGNSIEEIYGPMSDEYQKTHPDYAENTFGTKDSNGEFTIINCDKEQMTYVGGIEDGRSNKITVRRTFKKISEDTDGY